MSDDLQSMQSEIQSLRQQLADATQALHALAGGQVDAVASGAAGTPILLKAAQEALARSEGRFRALTENSTDGISITDPDGTIKYLTPPGARIFGRHANEMVGKPFEDYVLAEDRERTRFARKGLVESPNVSLIEFRVVRADGAVRWIESCGNPMLADPYVEGIVDNFRDITERKTAQEEREGFFQLSLDLLCIASTDGYLRRLNPAWEATLGWSVDELCGRPWTDFVHPDDLQITERERTSLSQGRTTLHFQNRYRCKDGTYRVLQWSSIPSFDGALIFACAHDLTDRLRAEEELRSSEARYRQIVNNASEGIWIYDEAGLITFMNPSMARMLGCAVHEGIGRSVFDFVPPESHSLARTWIENVKHGSSERADVLLSRVDGTTLWVTMNTSPLSDDDRGVKRALTLVTDITDVKKSEEALRRSDEQLRHAQKMEAVGSLAGGIAHDFNNLLSVILTFASGILEDLGPLDPLRSELREIERAGLRAAELTSQLLVFSRKQISQPVVMDVNVVAEDLQRMLGRTLGEHIHVELALAPHPVKIFADRGQVEQILMNLAVNARDAMPRGGTITLKTSALEIEEGGPSSPAGVAPGSYVLVEMSDTGEGIPLEVQPRIFEPFFTTKALGQGTGLGLSTVYGIVQQSGGHVDFSTQLNCGTTFRIYLPQSKRVPERLERPPSQSILKGIETILVVEDDPAVRMAICAILNKVGYQVLEARSASEAIPLFEQNASRIDLLLTDVVMPHMSGPQLVDRLVKGHPDVRVLFVSGYTENTIAHHGVLDAGIEFLQKPIMPAPLLKKVRAILDAPTPAKPLAAHV